METDRAHNLVSWRLGCSLTASLFLLIAGVIWWREGALDRKIERMLAQDGPTVGATREEVEAWLSQKGMRYERKESLARTGGYPAEQPPSTFAELSPGVENGFIVGRVSPSKLDCSGSGEAWIYFFFDTDHRLIQHMQKRWYGYL